MTETKKHILMIDDVAINLKCAAEVLKEEYRLSTGKSGAACLEFLESNEHPDLILLDIRMPGMDGYEVLRHIMNNPVWAKIPVIFLTADLDEESESRGLKMGAVDYIRKPFVPEEMLSRIESVFGVQKKASSEPQVRVDSLTGLWDGSYLRDVMSGPMDCRDGAFLLIDIDHFHVINERAGVVAGDGVLMQFAKCLQEFAQGRDMLARVKGDTFVMVMADLVDREMIRTVAQSICESGAQKLSYMDKSALPITISIGIARMPEHGTDFDTLYANADKALYFVKESGAGGCHFYREKK